MKKILSVIALLLCFVPQIVTAQDLSIKELDKLVDYSIKTFNVPGMALGVVKDGKLVYANGRGFRNIAKNQRVDENTLFSIASNSKSFTSASLAILVDRGKISWDDKVIKYIPEFKMYNDYVTQEFTIRDLLTHRSGLGLGAGDLMLFPYVNDFTVSDIIHNLSFLKPTSSFRTKYDYDNLLYIVAAEVVKRVSGISWTDFVEKNIMKPLKMNSSAASFTTVKDTSNIAVPYMPLEKGLIPSSRCDNNTLSGAAGIYTNITDLSKWVIAQLERGKVGNKQLFSEENSEEMWSQQTIKSVSAMPYYRSNFSAYALGWEVSDQNGYKQVSHTGGLPGMVSQVCMFPEFNLGIIILTNQQSGLAFMAVSDQIKDKFLGVQGIDRVKLYKSFEDGFGNAVDKETDKIWDEVKSNSKHIKTAPYEGIFTDSWWGDVTITKRSGKLYFASLRSPLMHGEMLYYKDSTFIVKWADRTMNADAFASFKFNKDGEASGFTMKAISRKTDFSYDFHDLDFSRK